jgi:hypothetical protein
VKPGSRLRSPVSETEVVVVSAPDPDIELTCCGVSMTDRDDGATAGAPETPAVAGEQILIGKRYSDETVGIELLCTKGGDGPLACNGSPMVIKTAKPLPSSD